MDATSSNPAADAAWVRSEHADVIKYMNTIYEVLVNLRYLKPEEVLQPPYGVPGKPSLAFEELEAVGFTPEVIALLGQLPYPSNGVLNRFSHQVEGVPIAPDSFVLSYLDGQDRSNIKAARQPLSDGDVAIPPWAFKLTTSRPDWGNNYLYDTRNKSIVRWSADGQFGEYNDQPQRPAHEAMDIMVGELLTLDWLPWRVEVGSVHSMHVYMRPAKFHQHMSSLGSTNRTALVEQEHEDEHALMSSVQNNLPADNRLSRRLEIGKAYQNIYMYKRKLYTDCGWPNNFRGEEFEERRRVVEKELNEVVDRLGPGGLHVSNMNEGRKLREWFRQKSGHLAA